MCRSNKRNILLGELSKYPEMYRKLRTLIILKIKKLEINMATFKAIQEVDMSQIESETTVEIKNFDLPDSRIKVTKDGNGNIILREPLQADDILFNENILMDADGNILRTIRTYPEGHPKAGKISEVETKKDGHIYLTVYEGNESPIEFRDFDDKVESYI